MKDHLLHHLSVFAARRAIVMREEAQLWDILARDFKREAKRQDEEPQSRRSRPSVSEPPSLPRPSQRLLVGIAEAARMMGISRSTLYGEITASRIAVRKAGKRSLIAVADIKAWFDSLPVKV